MERVVLAAIASFFLTVQHVEAYGEYSSGSDGTQGCKECHGDFRELGYTSLVDGGAWASSINPQNTSLHDVHRYDMLNGDCDVCHSTGGRTPVYLNSSNGGKGGYPAIACIGCHGRAEDATSVSGPGAGLRRHHFNAGETICLNCHDDANPSNYTPVNEGVLPPYYAIAPDTDHPNKPTDPFNPTGEEDYAGSSRGLDNDGNLAYDTSDPAFVPEPSSAFLYGAALLALLALAKARRKRFYTYSV